MTARSVNTTTLSHRRLSTSIQFSLLTAAALAGGTWLAMSLLRFELGILVGPPLFLGILLALGALWGAGIARVMRQDWKPLALAGARSWGFSAFVFSILLELVNGFQTAIGRVLSLSPHAVFTLSFLISVFMITGIAARSMTKALGRAPSANRVGSVSGLVATLGFLLVDLVMLSRGWELGRWMGGRSVMVTVMLIGNAGAALAGGAAMGWLIGQHEEEDGAMEAIDG